LYEEEIADLDSQLLPNYNATAKKTGWIGLHFLGGIKANSSQEPPQTQYADNALLQLKKLP
jgi:hypothetical protein